MTSQQQPHPPLPRCPFCSTSKSVQPYGESVHQFYCRKCDKIFEDVDDGEVGYGRPEKIAERRERQAEKRAGGKRR